MPQQTEDEPTPAISWFIPIKTVSEANCSEHWTKKHKRHKEQKLWIYSLFKTNLPNLRLPVTIKLTRHGKKLLDDDNLPVSMKYFRDAIADCLIPGKRPGQADSDPRIVWTYAQLVSDRVGVKIEIYKK